MREVSADESAEVRTAIDATRETLRGVRPQLLTSSNKRSSSQTHTLHGLPGLEPGLQG